MKSKRLFMRPLPPLLSIMLAAFPTLADAQAQAPSPAPEATPQAGAPAQPLERLAPLPVVQGLRIVPLAGKSEMNDLERHVMAPLVVQVVDLNDRPVEGAEVVFRFPINGPGASFTGGKASQTARTNGQGQAAALNWMANNQVGSFDVHVTASYGNQVGDTTFQMSNVTRIVEDATKAKKTSNWWSSKWAKLAIIGGAAAIAAGVVLATRGGGSSTPSGPSISISAGSPSIGGPH